MALNPVVAFGLAMGAAASIIVYLRHKDIKDAIMAFVKVFLATGTPLHFLMVGIYLGPQVNRLIYRRWSHNWSAFIVSLLGILPLIGARAVLSPRHEGTVLPVGAPPGACMPQQG